MSKRPRREGTANIQPAAGAHDVGAATGAPLRAVFSGFHEVAASRQRRQQELDRLKLAARPPLEARAKHTTTWRQRQGDKFEGCN